MWSNPANTIQLLDTKYMLVDWVKCIFKTKIVVVILIFTIDLDTESY